MSDRELANGEMREVLRWANQETEKLTKKLKQEGSYVGGLDAQSVEYEKIDNEAKRKLNVIRDKYQMMTHDK